MSTPEATHHDLLAFAVTPASNGNARKAQAVVLVDSSGAEVSATAIPTGAATSAKQDTGNTSLATIATASALAATAAKQDTLATALGTTADVSSATTVIGRLQKLVALLPAALGGGGGLQVEPVRPATGTLSSVSNSATSVTVLAANASRKGATIYNDDTAAVLKIKFGATASATSFVYAIPAGGYFEVPFNYTGIIDGIASVATGSARVTELT